MILNNLFNFKKKFYENETTKFENLTAARMNN